MKKNTVMSIGKHLIVMSVIFAMLIGILPALPSKAAESIETYRYEAGWTVSAIRSSYGNFKVEVKAVIDRSSLKADVVFKRSEISEYSLNVIQQEYPDEYEFYKRFFGQTECHAVFDVEDFKNDEGGNGKYDFTLTDPVWDDEPFLFLIDCNYIKEEKKVVPVLEDRQVVYVNIPHVERDSNGGYTDFGLSAKGKSYRYYNNHGIWYHEKESEQIEIKPRETYKIGRDNFGFKNAFDQFYTGWTNDPQQVYGGNKYMNGTRGYLLDESAYKAMIDGRDANQIAALNIYLRGRWSGACLGMTIVDGLLYKGELGISQFGGTKDIYSLKSPAQMNLTLGRSIMYYQILRNFEHFQFLNQNNGSYPAQESFNNIEKAMQLLEEDPNSPVVINFRFSRDGYSGNHSVLAYKVVRGVLDEWDDILVYDPNSPDKEKSIVVSHHGYATLEGYDYITVFPVKRAQEYLDLTLTYPLPAIGWNEAYITVDGPVTITVGDKHLTIRGDKIEGDLTAVVDKDEDSDEMTVFVNVESGQVLDVRRYGGTKASVLSYDTTALITGNANTLTMNPNGSVSAKIGVSNIIYTADTETTKGTLAVVSNKTKSEIFGTTVETDADEVTITPFETGAGVTTSGGKADITTSGIIDHVTFRDVDVTGEVQISSTGKESVLSSNGQEIARGTVTEEGTLVESEKETSDPQKKTEEQKESEEQKEPERPKKTKTDLIPSAGQKRHVVTVDTTVDGERIAMTVDMVLDKEITYKAKKIKPTELGLKIDLTELYNTVPYTVNPVDPSELFEIKYVSRNNLHKSTSAKQAKVYPKVSLSESKAALAGLGSDRIATLKKIVTLLNEEFKKNPCTYTIKAVDITSKSTTVKASLTWNKKKIGKVKSIKVTTEQGGKTKNFKLKASQYRIKVENASNKTVKITGKGDFTGTVTVQTGKSGGRRSSGLILADTKDKTGYKPREWSWKAEGEGYGRKFFTSGKYVRSDGTAVIYIDSGDSYDFFVFQAYSMASGARQSNYQTYENGSPYLSAYNTDEKSANNGNWYFRSYGNGCIEVTTDWLDEMYLLYDDPAGIYYLVKEKY